VLTLSRYPGETVVIGEDIEVTVVRVDRRGQVVLAFNAPKDIPIHRKEVSERIRARYEAALADAETGENTAGRLSGG
jgi:carbon storage regulator